MGRGRQKAKHTKVARDLKYFSPDTNYGALEKELGGVAPVDPVLQEDLAAWPEYAGSATSSYGAGADLDDDEDSDDVEQVEHDKSA